ncbi:hypothetical protein EIP86_011122 [Pleurotus ostreatoroseus]|nr:hypothetical protein EIP86_011122 [Pleurotus ostreatoroseus]
MAHWPCISDDELEVQTMKTVEASTAKETRPVSETATTPSSSEFQAPANDGPTVRVTDPDGQRTGASGAAINPKASPTSLTTDKLEDITSQRPIASVMPTEGSDPTISPGDCSALSMAHCTQDNDNNDTIGNSGNAVVDVNGNEADVTSPTIEGAENANEPLQATAAVILDESLNGAASSDRSSECSAIFRRDIQTIVDRTAIDAEDREYEDGGTTPHDLDTAFPIAHSTENDDDDTSPWANAGTHTDPTAPEDRPANHQGKCL